MKFIENLGGFFIEYRYMAASIFLGAFLVITYVSAPRTVVLDEKHWECGGPVPDGIGSRCTSYHFRGK